MSEWLTCGPFLLLGVTLCYTATTLPISKETRKSAMGSGKRNVFHM